MLGGDTTAIQARSSPPTLGNPAWGQLSKPCRPERQLPRDTSVYQVWLSMTDTTWLILKALAKVRLRPHPPTKALWCDESHPASLVIDTYAAKWLRWRKSTTGLPDFGPNTARTREVRKGAAVLISVVKLFSHQVDGLITSNASADDQNYRVTYNYIFPDSLTNWRPSIIIIGGWRFCQWFLE